MEEHAPGARFVMSSTGNVYNADATRPALESDACSPASAYGASKVAAEQLLRDSGLTWAVLRLPFVYGEGDGHLASIHTLAAQFGLHPAQSYAVAHHRDIAAAVRLALNGAMDGRIVNVTDGSPATVYEMARVAGAPIEGAGDPPRFSTHCAPGHSRPDARPCRHCTCDRPLQYIVRLEDLSCPLLHLCTRPRHPHPAPTSTCDHWAWPW